MVMSFHDVTPFVMNPIVGVLRRRASQLVHGIPTVTLTRDPSPARRGRLRWWDLLCLRYKNPLH